MTHLDNLESILSSGSIYAKSQLPDGLLSIDVANVDVQNRRAAKTIDLGPSGNLHDYVPFYFAPRSPMLYALHRNNVAGYSGGQSPMIYFVSKVESIPQESFVFTNGHPIIAFTEFFDDLDKLSEIDWQVMQAQYWNDTTDDPDKKRRRQAEFLVHYSLDLGLVDYIAVNTAAYQSQVLSKLENYDLNWDVRIEATWYY